MATANDKQVATLGNKESVWGLLQARKADFQKLLAKHLNSDRFIQMAFSSVMRNPELLHCDQASFMKALIDCASLGLEPDTGFGYAYLVPFMNSKRGCKEVQLIPGYKGLVDLARRSGQISTIYAELVYSGDLFRVKKGLNPDLIHEPGDKSDEITHAYAVCKFKDGGYQFEVMTRKQIDAIRNKSRASGAGPWVEFYGEMARKTVLRRLCKLLPLSPDFRRAIAIDDEDYEFQREKEPIALDLDRVLERRPDVKSKVIDYEPMAVAAASVAGAVDRQPGEEP